MAPKRERNENRSETRKLKKGQFWTFGVFAEKKKIFIDILVKHKCEPQKTTNQTKNERGKRTVDVAIVYSLDLSEE